MTNVESSSSGAERERELWVATLSKFAHAVVEKLSPAEQSQLTFEGSQELDIEKILQLAVDRADDFKSELVSLVRELGEFSNSSLHAVYKDQHGSLALNVDGEVVLKIAVEFSSPENSKLQVQEVKYVILTGTDLGKTLSSHEKPLVSPAAAGRWDDQTGEA